MTGHVLPFDASAHATADALLPFYVNSTLDGEELAFVHQHVIACEACTQEVAWLRKMFAGLVNDPAMQLAPTGATTAISAEADAPRATWQGRAKASLRATPPWTRWLLAAQLAAVALLGGALLASSRDDGSYRTLGSASAAAQLPGAVAVMFDPAASMQDMRTIVTRAGARVVDGPTATGVFVLEVPPDKVDQSLARLRADPAVKLAQPLGARAQQ